MPRADSGCRAACAYFGLFLPWMKGPIILELVGRNVHAEYLGGTKSRDHLARRIRRASPNKLLRRASSRRKGRKQRSERSGKNKDAVPVKDRPRKKGPRTEGPARREA